MGGGEMIREVKLRHSTFNEIPYRFEAGTPDVSAAIGLGAALDYLTDLGMDHVRAHEKDLVDYALAVLPERVPTIRIHGSPTSEDRAGIITFNLRDAHPHDVATLLDREAIAIRAGHHCTMPLHQRLGEEASARASFYVYTDRDDIDRLADALNKVENLFAPRPRPRTDPLANPKAEMDDLYRDEILEHYRNPHNFGILESADDVQGRRQPAVWRPDHADARHQRRGHRRGRGLHRPWLRHQPGVGEHAHRRDQGQVARRDRAHGQQGRARQSGHRDQPGAYEVRNAVARDAARLRPRTESRGTAQMRAIRFARSPRKKHSS